jgi:hypothetical protein
VNHLVRASVADKVLLLQILTCLLDDEAQRLGLEAERKVVKM